MENMDDWFITQNSNEHRQNALGWRRCNLDASQNRFAKQTGVRWSELLRLPYFDPIMFTIVDPMHCLFLGIARWIVKRLWIETGVLSQETLKIIQKKMNEFQIPSDLGRIPGKIYSGEGFANFTADQWRLFFNIYATVALWDHLSVVDRKILTHYVRICSILVSRIVETAFMNEAHQRLVEVIKLIETHYGSFLNSHRKIEPEIMRRLMNDNQIANLISSGIETKGLDLLNNTTVVGSLSETDEFSLDEMRRYLLYSQDIRQLPITGQEPFPGEMLRPSTENIVLSDDMLDRIVEYYNATYEMYNFQKPFGEGPEGSIVINVKMNKFRRCQIGSEIFSSLMLSRHVNSSFILAKFVTSDGEVDCYPGQI
ncbi:hypothetical protein RirG_183740 [Rhizophagus irregularis DAOM 197198w]|uniref:Transposase domain-containing protein n=1 Tax=Rhizophagus irregularis (strain DAOM 197198w) TaxID=1432141 RepID=A0A015LZA6_RHIIW|nr:hypothetical protein RirG_183740 [Rhizophagus irregularis DAOM 197198w]